MPTPKIQFESGAFYHVWSHANGLDNLFREEANYLFLLSKYAIYIHPQWLKPLPIITCQIIYNE